MKTGEEVRIHEIGGRRFRRIENGTLEQDICAMCIVHTIGIDREKPQPKETKQEFAVRLHWIVLESGKMYDLLAAIIIPERSSDLEWTPQMAHETAEFLRALSDPAHKKAARFALAEFNYFFAEGLLSTERSLIASKEAQPPELTAEPIAASI